jgi:hypothetical protein
VQREAVTRNAKIKEARTLVLAEPFLGVSEMNDLPWKNECAQHFENNKRDRRKHGTSVFGASFA